MSIYDCMLLTARAPHILPAAGDNRMHSVTTCKRIRPDRPSIQNGKHVPAAKPFPPARCTRAALPAAPLHPLPSDGMLVYVVC